MKSKLRDSLENNTNLPVAKYLCKLYIFFIVRPTCRFHRFDSVRF